MNGEDVTENGWTEQEQAIQKDFEWGVGPGALYHITRAEYETETDSIEVKDLIRLFDEYYLPKRNTYHNRGDFVWAKQAEDETPEEFWRRIIEIGKECNINTISAHELLISKYMTAITDKKRRDEIMKKNIGTEEDRCFMRTKHYEKKNQKNIIPEALIMTEERQTIKEEPIQSVGKFGARLRSRYTKSRKKRLY